MIDEKNTEAGCSKNPPTSTLVFLSLNNFVIGSTCPFIDNEIKDDNQQNRQGANLVNQARGCHIENL